MGKGKWLIKMQRGNRARIKLIILSRVYKMIEDKMNNRRAAENAE